MYPSEETARRNRWQDQYDAQTREHAWNATDTAWYGPNLDDDSDIPADVQADMKDWS
jgi:hypothetical protein